MADHSLVSFASSAHTGSRQWLTTVSYHLKVDDLQGSAPRRSPMLPLSYSSLLRVGLHEAGCWAVTLGCEALG